jgi:WD40 repeat protein
MLPNGWLASGSRDKTIKVWDLEERKEVRTLQGHTRPIFSLKVLKIGNLVSCSSDDTLKIWDPCLSENNLLLTIKGHGNNSWFIPIGVLSNDFLVTCSRDKDDEEESVMRVWDAKDGRLVHSLATGLRAVWAVLVLSNDQVAIGTFVGQGSGTIKIIDLNDQSKSRAKEKAHDLAVSCLIQLSNDNLVSSGEDGKLFSPIRSIKVWSFSDLALLQHIKTDHSDWIRSLSISRDETTLASGSRDNTINLWPISSKFAKSS